MTPLEIALGYIARGWNPVPVVYRSKRPIGDGWQRRIVDAGNVAEHFNGEQLNIGVVLGPSSHNLTDVDADANVAIYIGPYILPQTGARFGRASKRDSHRLYRTNLSSIDRSAAIAFDDPRKPKQQGRLIELRIGGSSGAQTVLPGSVHKSGETIAWEEDGTPATVDGDDLLQRVRTVAAYALMARYWPAEGSGHHDTARVVGGFLGRTGLGPETVRIHVEAIARAANSPRWRELCRTAEDAAKALAAGKHAFGLNGLREAFGADIAEKVCEWLDYQGPQENTADDATTSVTTAPPHSWEDPDISILDDRRGDLPPFPLDVLSPSWQQWATNAAHGAGCAVDYVMVPLFAVASSLVGTARRVQASKPWSEPFTCWTAIVGVSGAGKTPGLDVTKRALAEIEYERQTKIAELRRQHETNAERAKAKFKAWKEAVEAANKKGEATPPMPSDADVPDDFISPRLYVADATIQKLAMLLVARPSGLLLISDELASLFLNMTRYASGGSDREFWIESWNGKSYPIDRVGRPPLSIPHLLIGITGGFQPDKLARSFKGDQDGLYARCLFGWPAKAAYQPLTDAVAEVETEFKNALIRLIDLTADDGGDLIVTAVPLSAEARASFEEFRKEVDFESGALDGREAEWWTKAPTHVLRLAGTLAYLDWARRTAGQPIVVGEPHKIERLHLNAAVRLVRDYFWPHARAALRLIGLSQDHANARRVLRWAQLHNKSEVSREEVRRSALARSLDADATEHLLAALVRAGWFRPSTTLTGGRPSRRWLVNPKLSLSSGGKAAKAGKAS
jgi:hypothetical protein